MLCFVILILVIGSTLDFVQCKDHYGREFYLAMMPGYNNTGYGYPNIVIDIASKSEGDAILLIPYLQEMRHIHLNKGLTHVNITKDITKRGTFKDNRGIYINTTVPVAVFVTCQTLIVMDVYMALPVSSLGHRYTALTFGASFEHYIVVIAVLNMTHVNVTNTGNNVMSYQEMNQFDIYQFQTGYTTNTQLVSDKPIAVLSGQPILSIPGAYVSDLVLEEMLPKEFWTDSFIIPDIYPGLKYLFRVLTTEPVEVCYQSNILQRCEYVRPNDTIDFKFENSSVVITNTSVSIVQYGYSSTNFGDLYMSVVPGLQNYMNSYSFVAPNINCGKCNQGDNYVSIIVPSSEIDGLLLDNTKPVLLKQETAPMPFSNYSILHINVSIGYHELTHKKTDVLFGAMLYGIELQVGYGFPLGLQTPGRQPNSEKEMNTCYHCDDMSSLAVCDTVQLCDNNQICYSEKYVSRSGIYYKSGCLDKDKCQQINTTREEGVCLECCYEDFCNNKGCGDYMFPDRNRRGPMCYDCQHVLNDPKHCNKVTMCSSQEVCSIEKYSWGDDFHYKMGCAHSLCSPMRRAVPTFGNRVERSTPVCSSCCADDFCNQNCTSSGTGGSGPIIVG